jgi:penicillin amidase
MRDAFVARLRSDDLPLSAEQTIVVDAIASWNGRYDRDSAGAVAFEATMARFMPAAFAAHEIEAFDAAGSPYARFSPRVAQLTAETFREAADLGLRAGAEALKTFPAWGDMHRLVVQAQFASIPVIGGRYVFDDLPAAGSSETLLKTDHEPSVERHATRYGAQARHVSDLSDPDANWFVMLGGNDGWYNSSTFRDQVEAFQAGKSFKVPLRIETVRARFPHKTVLNRR